MTNNYKFVNPFSFVGLPETECCNNKLLHCDWPKNLSKISAFLGPNIFNFTPLEPAAITLFYKQLALHQPELRYDRSWGYTVMMARSNVFVYASNILTFVLTTHPKLKCKINEFCPDFCYSTPIRISPVWGCKNYTKELFLFIESLYHQTGAGIVIESVDRKDVPKFIKFGFREVDRWFPEGFYDVLGISNGRINKGLRLALNRFNNRNYKFQIKQIDQSSFYEISSALCCWHNAYTQKKGNENSVLLNSYINVARYLKLTLVDKLCGVSIKIDDQIVSLSIGEIVGDTYYIYLIAVTDFSIPGLAEFTFFNTMVECHKRGATNATYGFSPTASIYKFKTKLGPYLKKDWVSLVYYGE